MHSHFKFLVFILLIFVMYQESWSQKVMNYPIHINMVTVEDFFEGKEIPDAIKNDKYLYLFSKKGGATVEIKDDYRKLNLFIVQKKFDFDIEKIENETDFQQFTGRGFSFIILPMEPFDILLQGELPIFLLKEIPDDENRATLTDKAKAYAEYTQFEN